MFPTFIGILDIQSWWEVPSIAHFCSLFRAAFNLLDFDIEDLEEALLTDGGTEGRLLQELIVKLLEGCLPNDTRNDISTFNYQMFLRRLFRKKCQEYKCENPFNTDVDFELLPLRQKVEILRALCDFRLDAEDVEESLSNLDSDSLRVEPLGHDRKNSAYWYFYGTRLYREDYIDTSNSASHKQKSKPRDKKRKKRRNRVAKEEQEEEEKEEASLINSENKRESVWQVVCFTQQDWSRLVEKFRDSEYDTERKLYRTLSEDFMPEIPKLFDLKEKQQRRKLLQRNSSRVLRSQEPTTQMDAVMVRSKIKTKTTKGTKKGTQSSKSSYIKEETTPPLPTPPIQKKGRQTNNSLASAVGQIVIHTRDEVQDLEKKKGIGNHGDSNYVSCNYGYKYGYSFGIEEEERCVGMHKVLESVKDHVDAWPFIDPVDEEYAPRYYSVVRRPMDLSTMEEKLEGGSYKSISQFKRDFRLIVDNCRQYNGSDNEYTEMAINLKEAFDKAVSRYLESETSSDEDPTSPRSLDDTSTSPSYPSRHLSSSHHNARKRSKKSTKKSKSYKPESKAKSKNNEKVDEDEKRNKNIKVAKKKRGKKKGKKAREEELDEDEEEEEQEDQESEDAISETSIVASKRRKNVDVNSLLRSKKLSKESEELKTSNKKAIRERHQPRKDSEIVRSAKETKENKKRKEDFEEDYEPPVIAKSKSRKIEKKEFEETGILTDNTKKSKLKKMEVEESDTVFEEDKKQSSHVKTKKNRKKEKTSLKTATKADEKSDKNHAKQKDKKSKQKNAELKNGELKSRIDPKDVELESALDSKHTHTSKKLSAFIGNKDVDSLDSLKDKISDRKREEKLKNEKEKQRKAMKNDTQGVHSKKVPSNSNFHENDKDSAKRSKSKKGAKEDKTVDDTIKKQDTEIGENKKAKHTKGLGAEENATIQALNEATEKTLHDINKWLDDAPKVAEFSSGSDSPVLHASSIESNRSKVETARKRPSSMKIFGPHGPSRPKKIQRTIDRLQPGKSKGNLLLKKPLNLPNSNANDSAVHTTSDNDQSSKDLDEEPKLSLGTVLKNVDSIQLICKSLVSSPNPNFSNDDEEEDHALSPAQTSNVKEEKSLNAKGTSKTSNATEEKEATPATEEAQKPKSATPNLSAWFKAFGAPKSKKKEEEAEEVVTKKDSDVQEVFSGRQRRLSTGGSSISESVSSFSQESPPAPRAARSPQCQPAITPTEPIRGAGFYQDALSTGSSPYNSPYYATPPRYSAQLPPTPSPQNHPLSPAYPSSYEQQQQQAPPTAYPQVHAQLPHQSPYQKSSPQENPNEAYPQMSPQHFPQQLSANNQNQSPVYPQHSPQPMQPTYPQPSPQTPPSNYSQPSPQQPPTPNYSQPSPQQNVVTNYSQPSPQAVANYPQASPQQQQQQQQQHSPYSQTSPQTPPNYSQPSPQQHSPYAQSSPQQPYGRLSPQPPPAANYSQSSPQPPGAYSQPSPQPPSFSPQPSPQTRPANYSQPSPQPLSPYQTPQLARNYSQSPHQQIQTFSQHSPQASSSPFSEPSPQNSSYSQSSPQSLTNYSQPSPQQPATYSHPIHSPQTPPNYSQLSPQQVPGTTPATAANYSQPSPQQTRTYPQLSPQRKSTCNSVQPPQQSPSYSQPSPQQTVAYSQLQPSKGSDEYPAVTTSSANYPPDLKQNPAYSQSQVEQSPTVSSSVNESEHRTEYLKSSTKLASGDQQRNFPMQSESSLNLNTNHQIYQSSNQYPPTYANPGFPNVELPRSASRHGSQQQQQQQQQTQQQSMPQESRPGFTEIQPRGYLGKTTSGEQLPAPTDQTQLLAFQQNLTAAHESALYSGGFQPSGYSLPPPNSRPMYPSSHYFDGGSKSTGGGSGAPSSPAGNPPPMKKRAYEPSSGGESSSRGLQESAVARPGQEQFPSFDPMMALPQSDAVSVSQFDGTPFVGSLADTMATNPAYARLGLSLVGRAPSKEQQQLLTIPRPPPAAKPEHLAAYGRGAAPGAAELEQLNLLQSLQNAAVAAKNSQGILAISRRAGESDTRATSVAVTVPTSTVSKKRGRKSKHPQQQEQQNTSTTVTTTTDQQQATGIFPQYATTASAASADPIGALKVPPPSGSAFNFAASTSSATTGHAPFTYDKDATAAATFAFLTDEFRNPTSYYNMALRQQQQQQQQQPVVPVSTVNSQPAACNKLSNQAPRNYPPHPFLHTAAQRSAAAYVSPVSYVTPHGTNLTVDQAAYQQYLHSLYALQPPPHHRPSWL